MDGALRNVSRLIACSRQRCENAINHVASWFRSRNELTLHLPELNKKYRRFNSRSRTIVSKRADSKRGVIGSIVRQKRYSSDATINHIITVGVCTVYVQCGRSRARLVGCRDCRGLDAPTNRKYANHLPLLPSLPLLRKHDPSKVLSRHCPSRPTRLHSRDQRPNSSTVGGKHLDIAATRRSARGARARLALRN